MTPGRSGHLGGLFGISGSAEGPADLAGVVGVDWGGGGSRPPAGEAVGSASRCAAVALVGHSKSLRACGRISTRTTTMTSTETQGQENVCQVCGCVWICVRDCLGFVCGVWVSSVFVL